MKVIFCSFVIFLLGLQGLFRIFSPWSESMDYRVYRFKLETLLPDVDSQTNVVLGDSTSMNAIRPNSLPGHWVNLSIPCVTPGESYLLMKRLLDQGRVPRKVLISFSWEVLYGKEVCFQESTVTFGLFSARELGLVMLNHEYESYVPARKILGILPMTPWFEILLSRAFLHPDQIQALRNHWSGVGLPTDYRDRDVDPNEKGQVFCGDRKEFPFEEDPGFPPGEFDVSPFVSFGIDRLLSLLSAAGVEAHWVHPPQYQSYARLLNGKTLQRESEYFSTLERIYPGFHFHSDLLTLATDDFSDRIHVNAAGMHKYTAWLGAKGFL